MSWRDWAAAQYNRVLSIMRDTMDKTLFVRLLAADIAYVSCEETAKTCL
jgi:hypothetical protein